MEWKDLSIEAKSVVERCWSIHHNRPLTFDFVIGTEFKAGGVSIIPTEDTYNEVLKYQKENPQFDVHRIDERVVVKGNCEYGSWLK
ncbi:hypothetical protein [Paenibacillus donghaensis]|uniref:Uncharacterized protein n=1 Tax=Paenibacillus donghaensis TaxID=414771 RepID=A0A2Z2KJX5_9BACL|nr:hypothetical protein [Paenibacillus donghaensis]ASA22639.1 hypothetical protein B9T62_18705 [Paenibacillus donghaensis]